MTKTEFDKLSPIMQDVIAEKAEECEVELKDYLASTDDNYCILTEIGVANWHCGGDYDYVVYGDIREAHDDCGWNDQIITETQAIEILNKKSMDLK